MLLTALDLLTVTTDMISTGLTVPFVDVLDRHGTLLTNSSNPNPNIHFLLNKLIMILLISFLPLEAVK